MQSHTFEIVLTVIIVSNALLMATTYNGMVGGRAGGRLGPHARAGGWVGGWEVGGVGVADV